mmetsp:Transcript_26096/g.75246  ORF Transcript_26096/g.75246 Transcript_26096/m.75246 type:complete len:374 (+) Transcript_26096:85-1206(+)
MAPAPEPSLAALTLAAETLGCEVHDVWAWNLDEAFDALLTSALEGAHADSGAGSVILAFDVEFPGFLRQEPRTGARAVRYQVLRENVDRLRPIQLGVAVSSHSGSLRGVWSFNLRFDVDVDLHSAKSVAFLRAAGIDFPRHAAEGIDAEELGQRLATSELVGWHARAPWWVTFSGSYDFGYLIRMLTSDKLPQNFGGFDMTLSSFCPRRHELRDELPHGSLDSLARKHGLQRRGFAHTAGSDALLTLELFLAVAGSRSVSEMQRQKQGSGAWWSGGSGGPADHDAAAGSGHRNSEVCLKAPPQHHLGHHARCGASWWGASHSGMESWDVQSMWYNGPPPQTAWGGHPWDFERWDSSWDFQAPAHTTPMPLLPR